MGFSQGAATAFALTMQHPDLVQGIAGLVGFVPEDCETPQYLNALKELPVFMAVGKQDQFIPYDRALQCAHTLRRAGATLAYYEYNTGHKLNNQGMNDLRTWWASR
jgi:phospholipase/carboxylesterase